jgi:hypothetical protein
MAHSDNGDISRRTQRPRGSDTREKKAAEASRIGGVAGALDVRPLSQGDSVGGGHAKNAQHVLVVLTISDHTGTMVVVLSSHVLHRSFFPSPLSRAQVPNHSSEMQQSVGLIVCSYSTTPCGLKDDPYRHRQLPLVGRRLHASATVHARRLPRMLFPPRPVPTSIMTIIITTSRPRSPQYDYSLLTLPK